MMKPRVLKKLCKEVYKIVGDKYGQVWLDDEEPFAKEYLSWKKYKHDTMKRIFVVGGELDYFGEATDAKPLFFHVKDFLFWELGEQTVEFLRDENDNIIDETIGWPKLKKKLTGQRIIMHLRRTYHVQ
jgi:hypothetical protein